MLSDAEIEALPYRPCVGLMLLNRDGMIFAGRRIDNPGDAWQMPQGGVDDGEAPRAAALRELAEETGIGPGRVEVLRESACWIPYELPRDLIPKLWGGRFRGQSQKWFAMRFLGDAADIDIAGPHAEFRDWSWMPPATLKERIVPFKRDTYARVFAEFTELIA